MLELLSSPDTWVSLITLTFMEVVLGIDNIVFISIVAGKLPREDQKRARTIGLMLALVFRIMLLLTIKWIIGLTQPLFTIHLPFGFEAIPMSVKDLILLAGGLFLLAKSTSEIHSKLEGEEEQGPQKTYHNINRVILQIILVDIVFSFDSILTAVGLVNEVEIMIAAVIISMGIMLAFSGIIGDFVNRHPTVKMLALSFLIMIGVMLIVEAFGGHIPKGYIYFAMAFSLGVETLNMRLRKTDSPPVKLRDSEYD